MSSKCQPPAYFEFTEFSAPPTQSTAPIPQDLNSPLCSPAKSHNNSSPSNSAAPPPQSSVSTLSLKEGSGEKVTVVDRDDGPITALSQSVPLYAVPEKLKTRVRSYESVLFYSHIHRLHYFVHMLGQTGT